MKKYKTAQPVHLCCGLVGLTPDQATVRAHNIKPAGDGTYLILRPIMFKVGEVIGLEEPNKAMLSKIECMEKPPAKVASDGDIEKRNRK